MGGRRLAVAAGLRRAARRIERSTTPETGLVWLFGPPRSGTTWLHGMIRAHPDVDGPNEPLLGAHLGITDAAANPGRPGPERLLTDTSAARNDYLLAAEHEAVWAPIIADLVHARCLAPYRRVLGRGGRVVVKEPHGAHACALLHRITPESRCLFIVRDPRDVLDSVLDIVEAGWSGQSIGRGELDARDRRRLFDLVATRWRLTVSEMTALHDRLGTGPGAPAHLVRYEDLRAEPVTNLGAIVRWM